MVYSDEVMADAPIAYYRLGEASGTTMLDSSGNARDGTYNAVTLGKAGIPGGVVNAKCVQANSATGYGKVTGAAWMDVPVYTVECWARMWPIATSAEHDFVARIYQPGVTADNGWVFRMGASSGFVNDGRVSVQVRDATHVSRTMVTNYGFMYDLGWHHCVLTYDGTTLRLYIDGVFNVSLITTVTRSPVVDFTVLNHRSPGGDDLAGSSQYNVMDEVAYYDTVLSPTRIAAHYAAGMTAVYPGPADYSARVLADSPAMYLKLDETSGTTMTDSSGNSHHGTYSGATLARPPIRNGATASAKGGTTGMGIGSVANAAWLGTDETFSVEAWVKPNTLDTTRGVVTRYNGQGWLIWQGASSLTCYVQNASGTVSNSTPGVGMDGIIYHVVLVKDGTSVKYYVDGVLAQNTTLAGVFSAQTANLQIGSYNGAAQYSQATVSDVAYYDYPLTALQVSNHYGLTDPVAAGFTGWGMAI